LIKKQVKGRKIEKEKKMKRNYKKNTYGD